MTPADLATMIEQALLTVLDVEDFESTPGFEGTGVDVSGDDWTWHIEEELAYLALDDEPDDPAAYETAIEKNLTEPVLAALRDIDPATLIVLSNLLAASGDPISLAFAGSCAGADCKGPSAIRAWDGKAARIADNAVP